MRIILNQSEKRFVSCLMKNWQKSIRLDPINSETSIRMNLNQLGLIQTEYSIGINRNHSDLGLIRIHSDSKFGLDQSELGLIRIENFVSDWFEFIRIDISELIVLSQIDYWPFLIKRDAKSFSDWFGMIRIGSDTYIGMNRNSLIVLIDIPKIGKA